MGWAWDLQVRDGADGRAELWALAEWGQLRQQIEEGGYATASVVIYWNWIDPVTGEDQGPTLTSIAVTDQPFLQGMAPIAAQARRHPAERHGEQPVRELAVEYPRPVGWPQRVGANPLSRFPLTRP